MRVYLQGASPLEHVDPAAAERRAEQTPRAATASAASGDVRPTAAVPARTDGEYNHVRADGRPLFCAQN